MEIRKWIIIAGILQIILSFGSIVIPKLLNWKKELINIPTLLRQMFWVYAGYILVINFCFGLISAFAPDSLTDHSILATAVTFFIAAYWAARVIIQFVYFDRSSAPKGWIYSWGEFGLVAMFIFFTLVYGYAAWFNLKTQ